CAATAAHQTHSAATTRHPLVATTGDLANDGTSSAHRTLGSSSSAASFAEQLARDHHLADHATTIAAIPLAQSLMIVWRLYRRGRADDPQYLRWREPTESIVWHQPIQLSRDCLHGRLPFFLRVDRLLPTVNAGCLSV